MKQNIKIELYILCHSYIKIKKNKKFISILKKLIHDFNINLKSKFSSFITMKTKKTKYKIIQKAA